MQVIYHSSIRTAFYLFGHLSPRKKFWLQYTVFLWYMRLKKKLNWHLNSTGKKYSHFRLQYYDAWNLNQSISLDHYRKKIHFRFRLQCYCDAQDLKDF